jgi:ubiquinone/menaquinone biosynthesis C-methylase UbiE
MMISLSQRMRQAEWMDEPNVDPAELRRSLKFIRRVNALFGYTRATLSHFDRFARSWKNDQSITILDVATGSADIPRAIARWAKQRQLDVRIVGLDRHALTAQMAHEQIHLEPNIEIVRGDALRLPFADGSFDYVTTNMFLHHLDDDAVARVLAEMNRVARRGIVAADLLRNQRAYFWITLFTLFSSKMLKHDARVSIAQAFDEPEIKQLRDRAGLGYARFFHHFGHRFVLAGEK